ncbi:MAG: hypothetical protein ACKO0V_17535 [bacterium]
MISEKVARNIIFQLIVSACILAGSGCAKNKALQVNNRPIIEGGSTIGAESAPGSIIVNKPGEEAKA